MDAGNALEQLKQGNYRFVNNSPIAAGRDVARARELAGGQQPFAAILCCADSRVPPELIFDTGIGDLFVVRVAGNVANASSIGSIEFAVAELGVRLVVVMGHQSCGAVNAACAGVSVSPALDHIVTHIAPAVEAIESRDVDTVARANCTINADRLTAESEILTDAVKHSGLGIESAFYSFDTGEVEFDAN